MVNMGPVLRLEALPGDGRLQQGAGQAGTQSDLQYNALVKKKKRGGKEGRESKGANGDGWPGVIRPKN